MKGKNQKKDEKLDIDFEFDEKEAAEDILIMIEMLGGYGREILREELKIDRKGLIKIKMTLIGITDGKATMDKEDLFWLEQIVWDIFNDILEDEEDDDDWDGLFCDDFDVDEEGDEDDEDD